MGSREVVSTMALTARNMSTAISTCLTRDPCAGWSVRNSSVDRVVAKGHNKIAAGGSVVFEDVKIAPFIVDNASGSTPGIYVLNDTGLMCSDIEYQSVSSGKKVIVDGEEC